MAITKMESKKFVDTNEAGVTMIKRKPTQPGESMPIYIPSLMAYMPRTIPTKQPVTTNGNMVFKNAPDCKPNAPNIIHTQNYISPKFENNATWKGIVDESDPNPTIPANTPVVCKFTSGCLLNPTFNVN